MVDVRATSGVDIREKTADQTITVTVTDVGGEKPGVPGAPTVSTASAVSVAVTWVAPSNAGPAIEDYDYRSRVKDPEGSWVEVTNTTITALTVTIEELAENTEYEVAVRATNAEGTGEWSDPGSGSTGTNVAPAFSSSETFDVAENQTAVGTVQATDADDDVTGYTIEGGADEALFVIGLASGELAFNTAPNYEDPTDADGNNTYVVDVRATSGVDIREKTTGQTITVTVTDVGGEKPGVPGAPRVSAASVVSVTATWVAPSNAGPAIEDYDYRSRVKDPEGSWVEVTDTPITALSATIDGLAENTEYDVQVRATNAEGMGQWSEAGSGSTGANAAPVFTTSETFDVAENQTAVGTVQATADDDDDVTGYTIEGGADLALFVIGLTSGDLAFNTAPNYEAAASADGNNTYVVDVRATSGVDIRKKTTDQTITVTVTDVGGEKPGVPGAPTVSPASVVRVTATWVAPSNAGPAIEDYDYRYRVKDPEGSWVEVTDTPITALSATIDGLAENTAYDVQVRATNDEGTSEWSEAGSGSTFANALTLTVEAERETVTEGEPVRFSIVTSRPTPGVEVEAVYRYGGDFLRHDPSSTITGISSRVSKLYWEFERVTLDDVVDEADGSFTVELQPGEGYTLGEPSSVTVTILDNEAESPPLISVANARVREGPGAVLAFKVTLDRASPETATVDWETLDGRAKAGQDYVAGSGTLVFAPGETVKTVNVAVLDDAHDEGLEAMALYLWNEVGAIIADAVASGTIENSDHMPKAWLARFGRTVAEQVLDAVEDRLRAAPRAGVEARLAGEALPSWDGGGSRPGGWDRLGSGEDARDAAALAKAEGAEAQAGLAGLTDWLPGDRRDDPGSWSGAGSGDGRRATLRSRAVTGRDFLTGTSFALTAEAAGGAGLVSLWGRGALTRFDGRGARARGRPQARGRGRQRDAGGGLDRRPGQAGLRGRRLDRRAAAGALARRGQLSGRGGRRRRQHGGARCRRA